MESSFYPFPNLPLALQTSFLNHALPLLLISTFWTLDPTGKSHILRLLTMPSFRDLQSIAHLNDPFLDIVPIRLKCTIESRHSRSSLQNPTQSREDPIFLRVKKDILYFKFLESISSSATLDFAHFICCEENQRIKHIAIAHNDVEMIPSRLLFDLNRASPIEQLIHILKNLEILYVLGGDESDGLLFMHRGHLTRATAEGVPFERLGVVEVELVTVQQVNELILPIAGAIFVLEPTWREFIAGVQERGIRMMLLIGEPCREGEQSRRPPMFELREVKVVRKA